MRFVRPLVIAALATIAVASPALAQLPSPGVERETPVAVAPAPTANHFELAHFDTSNRPEGLVTDVFWNAFMKTADNPATPDVNEEAMTLVKNMGPATYSGSRLLQVAADAYDRIVAYKNAGQSKSLAFILGYRDAIYAALQADNYIPAEAP